ncbi:protein kinase domain-containing protein [Streptomyces sp. NRRL S-350]|uniref:protein kinase domain-containing protein n=1 Tax=Streptomyces sp. NRRL S-350 TaxID=1463902 RepID=UPI0004C073A2|nr:protein kinase [Streptomyces sp. NRRL S-350]
MGEFTREAVEALKAAQEICGPLELEEISNRRGSAVWKATGPRGIASIKLGTGEAAEVTAREASVLDQLPGYAVTAGRFDAGVWFVTPWLVGPSTWQVFRPLRKGEGGRDEAMAAAVGLSRAVADLHAKGWVHGDLQPQHGIHGEDGTVRLLDFAWSRQVGTTPWTTFDGTMIHLTAPELAARITTGPQPVRPTPASDVYALAGTLWTCITGRWPLEYAAAKLGRDTPVAELRKAIAARTVPLSARTPWPTVQNHLRNALLSEPDDRPTAAELADLVQTVDT